MNQPAVQAQIMAGVQGMVDQDALEAQLATALQSYVQSTMTTTWAPWPPSCRRRSPPPCSSR